MRINSKESFQNWVESRTHHYWLGICEDGDMYVEVDLKNNCFYLYLRYKDGKTSDKFTSVEEFKNNLFN